MSKYFRLIKYLLTLVKCLDSIKGKLKVEFLLKERNYPHR